MFALLGKKKDFIGLYDYHKNHRGTPSFLLPIDFEMGSRL